MAFGGGQRSRPEPGANRLRQPELWRDGARLTQIAQEPSGAEVSPQLAIALGRAAHQSGGDAVPLLTAVQARYPQDFWINFGLGATLSMARRWDEALGYCRAALAVRPEVSAAHNNLGHALYVPRPAGRGHRPLRGSPATRPRVHRGPHQPRQCSGHKGRLEEAIDHFQQALRLDPKLAVAQVGLSATHIRCHAHRPTGRGRPRL